jgi:hypothetical protein
MDLLHPTDEIPHALTYQRGVAGDEVALATLTRFFPASLVGTAVLLPFYFSATSWEREAAWLLGSFTAPAAVGFYLALVGMRRWIYPDADVRGRRSAVAGFVAPIAAFCANAVLRTHPLTLSIAVGVVVAVLLFFAWLAPTPAEMRTGRNARYNVDDDGGPK